MKEMVAMVCITALGITQLVMYGDGTTLTAAITAIAAIAGVSLGAELQKKKEQ